MSEKPAGKRVHLKSRDMSSLGSRRDDKGADTCKWNNNPLFWLNQGGDPLSLSGEAGGKEGMGQVDLVGESGFTTGRGGS